ncbi:MAG: hypothetical protein GY867_11905, partial [bacterium]|nr:hypothetical protein [bacterium]
MIKSKFYIGTALVCLLGCYLAAADVSVADAPAPADPEGCYCIGKVGNVNCDYADIVDIADLQFLVDHMFLSLVRLPNLEEANCDGVPGSGVDITDLQRLLEHLFLTQSELPDCPTPFNKAPSTAITYGIPEYYVNGKSPDNAATGVCVSWTGGDLVDYPFAAPDFEFEWRLYGPYTDDEFQMLLDSFVVRVFVTNEDEVFKFGQPPLTVCDTVVVGPDTTINCIDLPTFHYVCDTSYDGGVRTITCDTILIDTIGPYNDYGRLDTLLDVEHPAFTAPGSVFNRIAARSFDGSDNLVTDTLTTIYDAFAAYPHDTTVEMNFLFWVRAADPDDASIHDLAPPFEEIRVLDPVRTRDVLVVNWDLPDEIQRAYADSVKLFWSEAIPEWATSRGLDSLDFDADRDIVPAALYTSISLQPKFRRLVFSYKTAVMVSDQVVSFIFGQDANGLMSATYYAIATGLDTWAAMRSPLGGVGRGSAPTDIFASDNYRYYFGVEMTRYPGWSSFWLKSSDTWRIEDFIGAVSLDTDRWPDLVIDTDLMHRRYDWWGPYHWNPDSLDMLGRYAMPGNVASMPL